MRAPYPVMLGTGTNPDALFPVDGCTTLALALEIAMMSSPSAQARYLAIYGEPWIALADIEESTGRSLAPTTVLATIAR